jgi:cell division protease FtsH
MSPAKLETIINEASLMSIREDKVIDTQLLLKAFERIAVGMTTRKMTEGEDKARKVIIYHELGHFINEFTLKMDEFDQNIDTVKKNIPFLKISSEAIQQHNALGYVLNSQDDIMLKTKEDLEREITILYGGHASEEVFLNRVTTGAYNDIEKISKILKMMVFELGMYSGSKINFNVLEIENSLENIEKMKEVSEKLFLAAKKIVVDNKDLIEYLYIILEKEWVLDKDQIFFHISEFYSRDRLIS